MTAEDTQYSVVILAFPKGMNPIKSATMEQEAAAMNQDLWNEGISGPKHDVQTADATTSKNARLHTGLDDLRVKTVFTARTSARENASARSGTKSKEPRK